MPVITLLNGKKRTYESNISLVNVAEDIRVGFSRYCTGAVVNGQLKNMYFLIQEDSNVHILTMKDHQTIDLLKYSCIHLLSYACKIIWKDSKSGIGGIIDDKFYYDFDFDGSISEKDILRLEQIMKSFIKKKYDIIFQKILYSDLKKSLLLNGEFYNSKYIEKYFFNHKFVPVYFHQRYFSIDLGPQVPNVRFCKYFKLQNISGAYWNGNKNNKMLKRIYGIVGLNKIYISDFLKKIKINQEKDHRIINKKMKLYHKQKESPGMIFWHKNGWTIFQELKKFIRLQLQIWKYDEVQTPLIINESLWKKSGHIDNFRESMFFTISENDSYCIKPMNCPAHIQIFNKHIQSYRDLPVRIAEFGICHRKETSGSLYGLLRLKHFTQDDAHIFCTEEQVQQEIVNCIKMIYSSYEVFGFKEIYINFSTRPKKRIGNDDIWNKAELSLKNALLSSNVDFEYKVGEGAFYGPKIEFILKDCLNRLWQCGTIQLDFYLPQRFNSFYVSSNNEKKVPIMIHRAILGSIERFIGILLEQYSGYLPIWLSPVQVVVISIHHQHHQYVLEIQKKISLLGIRNKIDINNEKISFKVRKYILERVPYILICGDTEVNNHQVNVRSIKNNFLQLMSIDAFIEKIKYEIQFRTF
ncbi:threonine--tRNA ligase [Buchnera aphidicola]|uniref:threonine--tRNA ligase n=1 Tax=Buchnera aphidicola TaxID=9 RepID=UPI003464D995